MKSSKSNTKILVATNPLSGSRGKVLTPATYESVTHIPAPGQMLVNKALANSGFFTNWELTSLWVVAVVVA